MHEFYSLPFQIVREAFDKEKTVDTKECVTDLVTETDQEVEKVIISFFKETFPTHRYHSWISL